MLGGLDDIDPSISNHSGYFSCQWIGVLDSESGITQYAIAIGNSLADQSVLSRTSLEGGSNADSYTSPVISPLDTDLPYFITLFATNGANLEGITISGPLYFDVSPPLVSGGVFVHPNFRIADYVAGALTNLSSGVESSAACLLDTDVVSILFDAPSDPESGTGFRYELGVGFAPGSDEILSYEVFSPLPLPLPSNMISLYHRIHPLNFTAVGRRGVYFNVRIHNNPGRHSTLTSNAVFIKSNTTLEPNWIFDGIGSGFDVDYQTSTIEIGSSFYFGVNCPIRAGQWAVENVDGNLTQPYVDLDIIQFQNSVGNLFHVATDQVQLFSNETYRVLVQVIDFTGEVHIQRSNGVTVTTRGLTPGIVRDGPIPEQDLNYQESVTTLSACWSGFGDRSPEQEIAFYEVSAGSGRGFPNTRSNIAPYTDVGLNTAHVFTGLELNPRVTEYFVTVRAFAVSGTYVEAVSNGIVVGLGHSIIPGEITLSRYQADTSTLAAYWSDFQSTLPIRQYEWALGSTEFGSYQLEEFCSDTDSDYSSTFDVSGFRNVGLDTYLSIQGLQLRHNTTYYLTLRVLDQAKKCVSISTPSGVTIDLTPPTGGSTPTSVTLGPIQSRRSDARFVIYLLPGVEMSIEWEEFTDEESGVVSYEVGVFQQSECGNTSGVASGEEALVGFVTATGDLETVFTNVALVSGIPYVVVVQATNGAGVTGLGFSEPILLDDALPIPGDVMDGNDWNRDVTYQSDLGMLSAVFTHAKLPPPTLGEPTNTNGPCPRTAFFNLSDLDPEWTTAPPPVNLIGYANLTIAYRAELVSASVTPSGISIETLRNPTAVSVQVETGTYQTSADLSNGGTFQADILAANGLPEFQMNVVTSALFIDSGETRNVIAKFEPEAAGFDFGRSPTFSAFGLQIYQSFANATVTLPQRIVMWATNADSLGKPIFVRRDLPDVDFSVSNTYRIEFQVEQLDAGYLRTAHLYVNDLLVASLHGLPSLTSSTRIVFHTFNRLGYVPGPELNHLSPSVVAVFANVTLPRRVGHLCDSGIPFHSRRSPIVEFRAWAGTSPGLADVQGKRVRESFLLVLLTCSMGSELFSKVCT